MSVIMRIIQKYDIRHEKEFLKLEERFLKLEKKKKDFPRAVRLKPISGGESTNTLIWECKFKNLVEARESLDYFHGDAEHEELSTKQTPYLLEQKIEFYEHLFE